MGLTAVRAAVPGLDGVLAKVFEVDHSGLEVAGQLGMVHLRGGDLRLHVRVDGEDNGLGCGGGGGGVSGDGGEGARGVRLAQCVVHRLADEAAPVGAVRVRVLAGHTHETGLVHHQHELIPPANHAGIRVGKGRSDIGHVTMVFSCSAVP